MKGLSPSRSIFSIHTSASRVKSAIREKHRTTKKKLFDLKAKVKRIRNKAGSSDAVQRTGDIRAGAPEVAQKVAGSFNPKVPFIDKRLRLCLFSRATTSSERVNRPGIETSSADGRE